MAYKIEYKDINDISTIITIYKGVENDLTLNYRNRVKNDLITSTINSTTYSLDVLGGHPIPEYGGMSLCSITPDPHTYHFKQQRLDFPYIGYKQGNGITGEGYEPMVTNCPSHLYYKSQCDTDIIEISISGSTYEGESCLKDKIDILSGLNRTFCGGDTPLKIEWYASDKYTRILGSGVDINVIIENETDKSALNNILNGGYYVNITKNNETLWLGKLTSRYYIEPYVSFPYVVNLTASDQLSILDKFQPIMIDFNIPDQNQSLITYFLKALMGEYFYPNNFTGNKIDNLFFGNRLKTNSISNILENVYADPLNWMDDKNEYKSYKDILSEILQSINSRIFQWKGKWYILGLDAQYEGSVNLRQYKLLNDKIAYVLGDITYYAEYFNPFICSIEDGARNILDDAELRYEPPYRKLTINQNFNQNKQQIDGFCNANGDFFLGQDNISLEFDLNTRLLRHWDGDIEFIRPYGTPNSGWAAIDRHVNSVITAYKDQSIEPGKYDSFTFNVDGLAIQGARGIIITFSVQLQQLGVNKWLYYNSNDEWKWDDNYKTFDLNFSNTITNVNVQIESPFDIEDNDINYTNMRIEIKSIPFPYGAIGYGAIRNLQAYVEYSDWVSTEYKNELNMDINIPNSDASIIELDSYWGIDINNLINKNYIHRSSAYNSAGEPLLDWKKDGLNSTKPLMDWLANDMYLDNFSYTPTLSASYKSFELTPLSFIIDHYNRIYRFVSGSYDDKLGQWTTIHTEAKWLVPLGDFNPLDFNGDFFTKND